MAEKIKTAREGDLTLILSEAFHLEMNSAFFGGMKGQLKAFLPQGSLLPPLPTARSRVRVLGRRQRSQRRAGNSLSCRAGPGSSAAGGAREARSQRLGRAHFRVQMLSLPLGAPCWLCQSPTVPAASDHPGPGRAGPGLAPGWARTGAQHPATSRQGQKGPSIHLPLATRQTQGGPRWIALCRLSPSLAPSSRPVWLNQVESGGDAWREEVVCFSGDQAGLAS